MAGGVFAPLTPKPRGYDAQGRPIYHDDDTIGGVGASISKQAAAIPVYGVGTGLANLAGGLAGGWLQGEDPHNTRTDFSGLGDKARSWFNLGPGTPAPAPAAPMPAPIAPAPAPAIPPTDPRAGSSITTQPMPTSSAPMAAAPIDPEWSPTRVALEQAQSRVNDPDYDPTRWT